MLSPIIFTVRAPVSPPYGAHHLEHAHIVVFLPSSPSLPLLLLLLLIGPLVHRLQPDMRQSIEYCESGRAISSSCVPCSTMRPLKTTQMASALRMVERLGLGGWRCYL